MRGSMLRSQAEAKPYDRWFGGWQNCMVRRLSLLVYLWWGVPRTKINEKTIPWAVRCVRFFRRDEQLLSQPRAVALCPSMSQSFNIMMQKKYSLNQLERNILSSLVQRGLTPSYGIQSTRRLLKRRPSAGGLLKTRIHTRFDYDLKGPPKIPPRCTNDRNLWGNRPYFPGNDTCTCRRHC